MSKYRDILLHNLEVLLGDEYDYSLLNQFSDELLALVFSAKMSELKSVSEIIDIDIKGVSNK